MVDINPTTSIIIVENSGLNVPLKRQIFLKKMEKQDPTIGCLPQF